MQYLDITEGSKDNYHVQFLASALCVQKNTNIEKVVWETVNGADVAEVDKRVIQAAEKIINIHIQGLKQGVALFHGYIHFLDATIETLCVRHRGVDC